MTPNSIGNLPVFSSDEFGPGIPYRLYLIGQIATNPQIFFNSQEKNAIDLWGSAIIHRADAIIRQLDKEKSSNV